MPIPSRGRLLIVAAAVLWSTSGAFVKSPPFGEWPRASSGPTIAFYRALFAALVLLPVLRPGRLQWRAMLLPMVVAFAAMNVLFITAMTLTSAANTILLQYTAPFWMFAASVLLLGEPLQPRSLLALMLGMAGVAVILTAFAASSEALGVALGLASGLAYAGVAICLRVLRDQDSAALVVLNHLVAAAVLIPWAIRYSVTPEPVQLGLLAAMGTVQMAVPYVMFARGLRSISPQEAGVITLLEPVLNPLWVLLLWAEPVGGATLLGGAFILAGLAVRYIPLRRRPAR